MSMQGHLACGPCVPNPCTMRRSSTSSIHGSKRRLFRLLRTSSYAESTSRDRPAHCCVAVELFSVLRRRDDVLTNYETRHLK